MKSSNEPRWRALWCPHNIPFLPMMEPVVAALRDTETFGLIAVTRLEWEKFKARNNLAHLAAL